MNAATSTDRAIRSLNMAKAAASIRRLQGFIPTATAEEIVYLTSTIAAHQAVIDQGNAMIGAGY